jgi:two-component system, OmpR family, response regulator CpxR
MLLDRDFRMERLLVIDDDTGLCDLLNEYLTQEGFQVESVHDGQGGLEKACGSEYDLIVLDVMLPVMNGFDVLRHLRTRVTTPVVMLTARGEQVDTIVGLEIGADDYMSKPFNPRELVARIRAILRRTRREREDTTNGSGVDALVVGDVEMEIGTRNVYRGGERIDLTGAEFGLLEMLLRRAGQFVAREELIHEVLGRLPYAYDRSIDVHISKLRKKLGREAGGVERIRTIRNVGYLYSLALQVHGTLPQKDRQK